MADSIRFDVSDEDEAIERALFTCRGIARQMPSPSSLLELLEKYPHLRGEIKQVFLAEIDAVPDRKAVWVEALESEWADAKEALLADALGVHAKELLETAIASWKREKDPLTVWHYGVEVPLRGDVGQKISLLLALDKAAALRFLERMPYPGVINRTLYFDIEKSSDEFKDIFRYAPLVFEEDGSWVKARNVAALIAAKLVVNHARLRYNSAEAKPRGWCEVDRQKLARSLPALQAKLTVWMQRAFEELVRRQDGVHIAFAFMAQLSRTRSHQRASRAGGAEPWSAEEAAMKCLATALRKQGVDLSKAKDTWKAFENRVEKEKKAEADEQSPKPVQPRETRVSAYCGEGARTLYGKGWSYLITSLSLLPEKPSQDELELVVNWLEELLSGRDPEVELLPFREGKGDSQRRLGRLFSLLPNPDERLRSIYKNLESQRRRGLFYSRYQGPSDLESALLLCIGLHAARYWAARLREGGESAEPAQKLFSWIYEQARRLWLTCSVDAFEIKRNLVSACFAFMPMIWGQSIESVLKCSIPPIANDPLMLVNAYMNLWRNEVGPAELMRSASQSDLNLEAALRDFAIWQVSGKGESLSVEFKRFADELGVEVGEEELGSAPPPVGGEN